MIATLLMTGLLVNAPRQDAWDLKFNPAAGKALTYKTVVEVKIDGGEEHKATFDFVTNPGEADPKGDRKSKIDWKNVEVDGNETPATPTWEAKFGKDGAIREFLDPKDDDYRRCLSIFSFVYPEEAAKVGTKWTLDLTPAATGAKKMKYEFEAKAVEKVGDKDALKVVSTQKEEGDNGIKADGTWWVARDGSILKFKLDVKNWIVPFTGPNSMNATITGEAK